MIEEVIDMKKKTVQKKEHKATQNKREFKKLDKKDLNKIAGGGVKGW
jgi:bacteriocin-like protein